MDSQSSNEGQLTLSTCGGLGPVVLGLLESWGLAIAVSSLLAEGRMCVSLVLGLALVRGLILLIPGLALVSEAVPSGRDSLKSELSFSLGYDLMKVRVRGRQ